MIAVFRIRFDTNNNPATVWSDSLFENWLHVGIPFSLGNFWWESSWGNFDLNYQLFPELVMADPRSSNYDRDGLVNGTIKQVTDKFAPLWEQFDVALLWFAQQTDLFGGGTSSVLLRNGGTKMIPISVMDRYSPFDAACQELGHSFGLAHEVKPGGVAPDYSGYDYGSPYSVMSARNDAVAFLRPADPRLPDGSPYLDAESRFFNLPANQIVGPTLAAAQLVRFPWFGFGPRVVRVPVTYSDSPANVTLYALDHARARSQSEVLPVLAIVPPKGDSARTYAVELRRGGHGYDKAIGSEGAPAGLVVHSFNPDSRVEYDGVLRIPADLDWTCNSRIFTLRLLEIGPDLEFVRFLVADGAYQSDILWHNSQTHETQIWRMNGHRVIGRATVLGETGQPTSIGPPFSIVGVGDFNNDGKADILWHNSQTHETQIWFMNGPRVASRATVLGESGQPTFIGPPFSIVGVGDFNNDGNSDILWHNSQTHETQIWFMNGPRVTSRATVLGETGQPTFIGPPFSIVGVGDFNNHDANADIVWHNSQTQETQIWRMDDHRVIGRATVLGETGQPTLIGPPFSVVGTLAVAHRDLVALP